MPLWEDMEGVFCGANKGALLFLKAIRFLDDRFMCYWNDSSQSRTQLLKIEDSHHKTGWEWFKGISEDIGVMSLVKFQFWPCFMNRILSALSNVSHDLSGFSFWPSDSTLQERKTLLNSGKNISRISSLKWSTATWGCDLNKYFVLAILGILWEYF